MIDRRRTLPFELRASEPSRKSPSGGPLTSTKAQVIPRNIANRMVRRIMFTTGLPSLMGMAVFALSYVFVSQGIAEVPPIVTLLLSGGFFFLGLAGLSYGVLSASWEPKPGSILGLENIKPNLQRMRSSVRAQNAVARRLK